MPSAEFFYRDPDAPAPNRPIGVGVLALIEREEKLLLERRADCGRWGLIGGAVEPHETLQEALRREVMEETGLSLTAHALFGISQDPSRIARYPDGNTVRVISFVYRAEVAGFDALRPSGESLDLRFFRRDELPRLDIIETARPIIRRYLSAHPPPVMLD